MRIIFKDAYRILSERLKVAGLSRMKLYNVGGLFMKCYHIKFGFILCQADHSKSAAGEYAAD